MIPSNKISLTEAMPLLARNDGDWYGTYLHLDPQGHLLDQHRSHLIVQFSEGAADYHQRNIYTWADGREVAYEFVGRYEDGFVIYDTDRMWGKAWEADARTLILYFYYKSEPEKYIYEYIHLSDDGQHRTRIWHWFNANGEVYKHTLIKETRTPPA